ncbi:MAG TPA: hypothetical protein VM142_07550 [Acidimicrobiales bacterium]|nr:hypothetical protein [Acidimicrobiales bacterium]
MLVTAGSITLLVGNFSHPARIAVNPVVGHCAAPTRSTRFITAMLDTIATTGRVGMRVGGRIPPSRSDMSRTAA